MKPSPEVYGYIQQSLRANDIDGLVQDYSISIANALEIL